MYQVYRIPDVMGIRDTLFAIITFVIMVYNGVIIMMENGFADGCFSSFKVIHVAHFACGG